MSVESVAQFVAMQLEGPYKWYALLIIVGVITALVTRFIFRTLKWFLVIVAFAIIILYLWSEAGPFIETYLPFLKTQSLPQSRLELLKTIGEQSTATPQK